MSLFSCFCSSTSETIPFSRDIQNVKCNLILIGLDNAGKTTILSNFAGDLTDVTSPTWGFNEKKLILEGGDITFYDVGGGKSIRGYWGRYFHEVHGLVFVIDSADSARLEEISSTIKDISNQDYVKGKPILVFANKQDLPAAVSEVEIAQWIGLDQLQSNAVRIFKVTALKSKPEESSHPNLNTGLQWLLDNIREHYEEINQRVIEDSKIVEEIHRKEIAATLARVAARKEAEEKEEKEAELQKQNLSLSTPMNQIINEPQSQGTVSEVQASHPNSMPASPIPIIKPDNKKLEQENSI